MQTVTLSVFRFAGFASRLWAFGQMAAARRPLSRLPGLNFYKLFGTGSDDGFNPTPNLGVYACLCVWRDQDSAERAHAAAPVFARYRDHAAEAMTLYLQPIRSWGRWSAQEPFAAPAEPASDTPPSPVAVLTRASVKPAHVLAFWRRVPGIRRSLEAGPRPLFQIGMGERPWVNQVTFSVWRDYADARAFAYGDGPHRAAIEQVRARDWFSEELYARFGVLGSDGAWNGRDPLRRDAEPARAQTKPARP